ncbi:PIN domain-containing protein [Geodermatophilus sp. DSM 45219]|uniref:PIN domain-containing protein n=1 Tax=Geodermatophilus sp. DSM 45219 TaxID=1881103 RepID=UPI00088B829B|nr:PIN domain-containing protein [Geodermatophilus sp. DSM 45219]SDN41877.1 hypothetical protein SAMN05428965_0313 [Geodermatophilus sp. DSM 45219]
MLRLLVDTSAWLDLAKDLQGEALITTLGVLEHEQRIELLVPQLVLDEFQRNRTRVATDMTRSTAAQLRRARRAIEDHGRGAGRQAALDELDNVVLREPMILQMATRNFDQIEALLQQGQRIEPSPDDQARTVERAITKRAPFHRDKNSVADALLMEMYASVVKAETTDPADRYCFVTHNTKDFSTVDGDTRLPHPDFAPYFDGLRSHYLTSLSAALTLHFPDEFDELLEEFDLREEPRSLDEILAAEQRFFDLIWYQRSINYMEPVGESARRRIEQQYEAGELPPYDDFGWGMLNGKLSTLRWVLGSEWDFLDT